MEITDEDGRQLYEAVKEWLKQFDQDSLTVMETGPSEHAAWAVRIDHPRPGPSKASVVWTGDPAQVYLGQAIWIDRLEDDPDIVLPYLDAAANGLITEKVWRDGPNVRCSRAEIQVEGRVLKASYGTLNPWERGAPPDEVFAYERWPRKPPAPR